MEETDLFDREVPLCGPEWRHRKQSNRLSRSVAVVVPAGPSSVMPPQPPQARPGGRGPTQTGYELRRCGAELDRAWAPAARGTSRHPACPAPREVPIAVALLSLALQTRSSPCGGRPALLPVAPCPTRPLAICEVEAGPRSASKSERICHPSLWRRLIQELWWGARG
jgi:hypothetical protein